MEQEDPQQAAAELGERGQGEGGAESGLLRKPQTHKFQMLSGPENILQAPFQVRADVISRKKY